MTAHVHEEDWSSVGRGTTVLDIGDDVGAIVLYTPPDLVDREFDVIPLDGQAAVSHSQVHHRHTAVGEAWAAVYPSLPEGRYRLAAPDPRLPCEVRVVGGEVSEVDWRGRS